MKVAGKIFSANIPQRKPIKNKNTYGAFTYYFKRIIIPNMRDTLPPSY